MLLPSESRKEVVMQDVISDHASDAAKRLSCESMEAYFMRAATSAGYGDRSEDRARELYALWSRSGFWSLPEWVRLFTLDVCTGVVQCTEEY